MLYSLKYGIHTFVVLILLNIIHAKHFTFWSEFLGSSTIHAKGAFIKSILFAGPSGSGKKSLVYAICNEIGATLMDLSAENVNGKYPGKEGLDMLMHLLTKVGRMTQPTVVYIKDAENYFWRKQPATSVLVCIICVIFCKNKWIFK